MCQEKEHDWNILHGFEIAISYGSGTRSTFCSQFLPSAARFDLTYFWMQCNPSLSMYPRFPGQLGAWLVTDTQVFPAFDCPVFPVVSLLSSKHFTWSTRSLRYSARPTSCAMSLLLVRFFSSSGDWMYKKRNNYFLPLFRFGMKVEAFIPEAVCNLSLLPLLPKNR